MKNLLFTLILLLIAGCNDCLAQVTKEKKIEDDGFVWYELKDGSRYGAESESGKTIIPLGDYWVIYHPTSGGWFMFEKGDKEGACTKDGRYRIPISRGYSYVCYHAEDDGSYPYFKVKRDGLYGACDLSGKEIIAPRYKYIIYVTDDGFKCKDSNGEYVALGIKLDKDGIYRGSNNSYASTSSGSSSSQSTSNSTDGLIHSGLYTRNSQGRNLTTGVYTGFVGGDFTFGVDFYSDHISALGIDYKYAGNSGRRKKYSGEDALGFKVVSYVDDNYNMTEHIYFPNQYTFQTEIFEYTMQKGEVTIDKVVNGGGAVGGNSNVGGSSGSSSKGSGHQCRVCGGTGQVVDNTYYGNASQTKWCDICKKRVYVAHRHKQCSTCGGSGWISGY